MRKSLMALCVLTAAAGSAIAGPTPSGWNCAGTCGASAADGVVSLSPTQNAQYEYISTAGGAAGAGQIASVGGTNGSQLDTPVFTASAGDNLQLYFNFVTSDGAAYSDYAWAALYQVGATNPVAYLFTARTAPSGTIAPGLGLPADAATLTPGAVNIIPGAPAWSPLGGSSNTCYDAGCGYTGWIQSDYAIVSAGQYFLSFGVSNWSDTAYDTGLAIDGVSVNGVVIPTVPEPGSLMLAGLGLLAVALRRKR